MGLESEILNMNFDSATCTIPSIKQITIKDLLYSTANATQYSVMIYKGTESKKERIYVYVQLIHFAVYLKLTV